MAFSFLSTFGKKMRKIESYFLSILDLFFKESRMYNYDSHLPSGGAQTVFRKDEQVHVAFCVLASGVLYPGSEPELRTWPRAHISFHGPWGAGCRASRTGFSF